MKLRVTADSKLVSSEGGERHAAALKQGYDGGWSISSDPEPLPVDFPAVTFETRDDLIEALRGAGYEVEVEAPSRDGAGN